MANDCIDILEVPVSSKNNRYLLVIQDYFTKWADAIPLPDQTASRITAEIIKLCSVMGLPDIIHSDQGRNFESMIFHQTLEAFNVQKTHTTAYHPQGDGMVERFNRSLLQMFRSYVENQEDWEKFLPLLLYAYRSSSHSSTGVSPFMMIFGRHPQPLQDHLTAFDPGSYQAHLQAKLAEFRDLVEVHTAHAADNQKQQYNLRSSSQRSFSVGDTVWLSIPTAGKLDPRWEGNWKIKSVKSSLNMEITDDKRTKVVHVNRLRHRIQPSLAENDQLSSTNTRWNPPQTEHTILPPETPVTHRYPQRERCPPDYFHY